MARYMGLMAKSGKVCTLIMMAMKQKYSTTRVRPAQRESRDINTHSNLGVFTTKTCCMQCTVVPGMWGRFDQRTPLRGPFYQRTPLYKDTFRCFLSTNMTPAVSGYFCLVPRLSYHHRYHCIKLHMKLELNCDTVISILTNGFCMCTCFSVCASLCKCLCQRLRENTTGGVSDIENTSNIRWAHQLYKKKSIH